MPMEKITRSGFTSLRSRVKSSHLRNEDVAAPLTPTSLTVNPLAGLSRYTPLRVNRPG